MAISNLQPGPSATNSRSPLFETRMESHEINGVIQLSAKGWDAVNRRLAEAHALLCVIGAAAAGDDDAEFGNLNTDIQQTAIDGVKHLIAEADFYCDEVYYSERNG